MTKKAIVYLDGYNFYYGRLRNGPYKWLNLLKLFESILRIQDPSIELLKLNYFTSPAKAKYATHGQQSEHAQSAYHRALKQISNKRKFAIILGNHEINPVNLPKAPPGISTIDKSVTERVWRVVEKKTDIQIAVEMYSDAAHNACDLIVLCSNDTDLEPALKKIAVDYPGIEIAFIAAVPPQDPSTPEGRRPNKALSALANWTRHSIRDEELAAAQLPGEVNTGAGTVCKPEHW
jgi:uncharacterized LabA/DUF88 family protein